MAFRPPVSSLLYPSVRLGCSSHCDVYHVPWRFLIRSFAPLRVKLFLGFIRSISQLTAPRAAQGNTKSLLCMLQYFVGSVDSEWETEELLDRSTQVEGKRPSSIECRTRLVRTHCRLAPLSTTTLPSGKLGEYLSDVLIFAGSKSSWTWTWTSASCFLSLAYECDKYCCRRHAPLV